MGFHAHGHHEHSGSHAHAPKDHGAAFALGVALNLAFVGIETVYGLVAHSMALVADAAHNLSDVLGLALAWGATILARRPPTGRRTYGFRSTTILASLVNAVVLLLVTGSIASESTRRLFVPTEVPGATVVIVALAGVVVNGSSALLFLSGRKNDLNARSAFLHLASDAVLALGVALSGAIMMATHWPWLDPIVSLALAAVILVGAWSVLRSSIALVLAAVPEGIDPEEVRRYLATLSGVREIHDLHIWAMSTTESALTAHLVMPRAECHPAFLSDVCGELHERFGIEHATLQVDPPDAPKACRQVSVCAMPKN